MQKRLNIKVLCSLAERLVSNKDVEVRKALSRSNSGGILTKKEVDLILSLLSEKSFT